MRAKQRKGYPQARQYSTRKHTGVKQADVGRRNVACFGFEKHDDAQDRYTKKRPSNQIPLSNGGSSAPDGRLGEARPATSFIGVTSSEGHLIHVADSSHKDYRRM